MPAALTPIRTMSRTARRTAVSSDADRDDASKFWLWPNLRCSVPPREGAGPPRLDSNACSSDDIHRIGA